MTQPLRIHHQDKDYFYQLISPRKLTRETTEIELLLDNSSLKLLKNEAGWTVSGSLEQSREEVVALIVRSLASRYGI
ncbi:hypothetical protein GS399_04865 [Pedobacter sp. HMF7647]|uniref:Uncharacterized protein n=1 Tax=Hufsiella arboris TaxID=2695275 RepID=A0A7K1Y6U4_9SPHI|nr:hypothetical protein [Hufsiella arboris]MXV50294.1 hypothetical protein [Hufsiella arboris]